MSEGDQKEAQSKEKAEIASVLSPLERAVREAFADSLLRIETLQDGKIAFEVKPQDLLAVGRELKERDSFQMTTLHCVTAVDFPAEKQIEMVYHLHSMPKKHWLVLKTRIDRDNPEVSSLCSVWQAADWLEREQYDLLGVIFKGHPDLRRILLPDYWPGYPLRKDWVEPDYKELTRLTIEGAFDT